MELLEKKKILTDFSLYFPELDSVEEVERLIDTILGQSKNLKTKEENFDFLFNIDEHPILKTIDKNNEIYRQLNYFNPIINYYIADFYNTISKYSIVKDINEFTVTLIEALLKMLNSYSFRVIVLEVNKARENNLLLGNGSSQRFTYFFTTLLNDREYLLDLYNEYSQLTILLLNKTDAFFSYIKEIIANTSNHIDEITSVFNLKAPKIENIHVNAGDTHCNGKSVSKIFFDGNFVLVYKPRDMKVDENLGGLFAWLNTFEEFSDIELKSTIVLAKDNYSWQKYVRNVGCFSLEGVERYFTRMGMYLCLFYSFGSTDLHHENIIAHGEYPLFIDLETIFTPSTVKNKTININKSSAIKKASKLVQNSVVSINLLPTTIIQNYDGREYSIDVGGMSVNSDYSVPIKSLDIVNKGQDNIKIEKADIIITQQKNNPILNGTSFEASEFIEYIEQGFILFYKFILNNRKKYLKKVNELFSNLELRFILKPTSFYTQLINISVHPIFLKDYLSRKILLLRTALDYSKREELIQLYKSEHKNLDNLDVPYFKFNSSKRYIITPENNIIPNILESPAINKSVEKINSFSDKDLNFQLSLIRSSFFNLTNSAETTNIKLSTNPITTSNTSQWINSAKQIAEFIIDTSITGVNENNNSDRCWMGLGLIARKETWQYSVLPMSLYNGTSGFIIFLSYLSRITNNSYYQSAVREAIEIIIYYLNNYKSENGIGAYTGLSGYLYALHVYSSLFKDLYIQNIMYEKLIPTITNMINEDKNYDFMSGSAGCLAVLLYMYNEVKSLDKKKVLISSMDKLVIHITRNLIIRDKGIAWTDNGSDVAYTGFAHGISGIVPYLYKYSKLSGIENTNVIKVIEDALLFRDHMFSDKHKNWFTQTNKNVVSYGWCNGSPGILLSNTILMQAGYSSRNFEYENSILLESTINKGIGNNFTYCHGDLGSLATLDYYAKVYKDVILQNKNFNTFSYFHDQIIKPKIKNLSKDEVNILSLMIGLIGIGYSLIKNSNPEIVPDFLWFNNAHNKGNIS